MVEALAIQWQYISAIDTSWITLLKLFDKMLWRSFTCLHESTSQICPGLQQAIKRDYPQARLSWLCLLFMMTGWHSWTSSQLLQLLLSYNHLPQECQLQSIIYSIQLPIGHLIFLPQKKQRKGGYKRETCVLRFSRIKMHQKWKMKETKYNRVSIHHLVSFSASVFGSLIMSERQERGSVYKTKLFDLLRRPRLSASAFVSISPITKHLHRL